MSDAKILVIEDNPADVELLRIALDRQGQPYTLEVLHDGEQALAFIEEHAAKDHARNPCVILLDLYMPKYNGMEVLHAVKREPKLAHTHILMLSSLANPREKVEILGTGAMFRAKPQTIEAFYDLGEEIFRLCSEAIAA